LSPRSSESHATKTADRPARPVPPASPLAEQRRLLPKARGCGDEQSTSTPGPRGSSPLAQPPRTRHQGAHGRGASGGDIQLRLEQGGRHQRILGPPQPHLFLRPADDGISPVHKQGYGRLTTECTCAQPQSAGKVSFSLVSFIWAWLVVGSGCRWRSGAGGSAAATSRRRGRTGGKTGAAPPSGRRATCPSGRIAA